MRKTTLPLPLALALALAIALLPASCGKGKDSGNGTTPTGTPKPPKGTAKSSNPKNGNVIAGNQIMVLKGIVFKTGELKTPLTGLVVWQHKDGSKQMESYCEAGLWNGPSKWWYKNKKLAGEGTYKEGKWEGDYKEWHENGELKCQVTFRDGKEEGKEIWKYENGKTRSVTIYKGGKKDGKAEGHFESGAKNWEAGWKNDVPDGEYLEWYENGDKTSVLRYVMGKRQGKEQHWYKSAGKAGKEQPQSWEVEWANDKKHGIERHWYPSNVNMKWMTYVNGVKHGEAGSFFENGRRASQRIFQNDKETYVRQWDKNGKLTQDGAVGQPNRPAGQPGQPQGRTHRWTQQTITSHCNGKSAAEIEALFGKADADAGGTLIYRGLNVQNPRNKQMIAATVRFTMQSGKAVKTAVSIK